MVDIIFDCVITLAISCLIILALGAIGKKNGEVSERESPHVRLLTFGVLGILLIIILIKAIWVDVFGLHLIEFPSQIGGITLVVNTVLTMYLWRFVTIKKQERDTHFFILAMLAFALINVSTNNLLIKMMVSLGWTVLSSAVIIKTTTGGKKAELGLKMLYNGIFSFTLFCISIGLFLLAFNSVELNLIFVKDFAFGSTSSLALFTYILASVCLMGTPPFHFGHIDCAEGGNNSMAFFFTSNAIVQGGVNLLAVKNIFIRSEIAEKDYAFILLMVLFCGFLVLWLRAMDQVRVRRTIIYIAATSGPIFGLSLIFGNSHFLPPLIYYLAAFSFPTLVLFSLYGALSFMTPLSEYWQTFEDIAGFGRIEKIPSLWLIVALAAVAGLPGTMGYFIKLSLIATLKDNWIFSAIIFISIAVGAACLMRIFVFLFSKRAVSINPWVPKTSLPFALWACSILLIVLGFFPFIA